MVNSMGLLMESSLEDGEAPMVIGNDYINVLCQVTSTTGALNFESGEWRLPCRPFMDPASTRLSGVNTTRIRNQRREAMVRWRSSSHKSISGRAIERWSA